MKNKLLILLCFFCLSSIHAQTDESENDYKPKPQTGLQLSSRGLWLYHEQPIFKNYTVRGEIGSVVQWYSGTAPTDISFLRAKARPSFNLEVRRYFLGTNKSSLGKYLASKNSFFAFQTHYSRGILTSGYGYFDSNTDLTFTGYWGIKKELNKHLNFEFGAGLGYNYSINQRRFDLSRFPYKRGGFKPMLRVRVGYKF